VRKTNKSKFFVLVILIVSTFLATVLQVGASRDGTIIGDIGTVTDITFYHSDNIPLDVARQIEKSILGVVEHSEDTMIQAFSILCIFGHSWSRGISVSVQHGVYSTNPRCREIRRSVEFCTRCSVTIILSESSWRISCC
jgi:hypothetical protein